MNVEFTKCFFCIYWYNHVLFPFCLLIWSVQFSYSVMSNFLQPHAHQASLSSNSSWSLLKPMSIELVMPSNHLISLSSPSPPTFNLSQHQGSFQMSQFFTSGGQSIWVLASVLPMNIQDWVPLEWTGWISLQSKGLLRVFSTPQFKSFNSSMLSFLYSPAFTPIRDYWKNHSFDYMVLCWQSLCFLICCLGWS